MKTSMTVTCYLDMCMYTIHSLKNNNNAVIRGNCQPFLKSTTDMNF